LNLTNINIRGVRQRLSGKKLAALIVFLIFHGALFVLAQQSIIVKGTIKDENNNPLAGASIVNLSTGRGVISNDIGYFEIPVIQEASVRLSVYFIGYEKDTVEVIPGPQALKGIDLQLKPVSQLIDEVIVESWIDKAEVLKQIDIKSAEQIPAPSGNIESYLTTMGASSRNEMSYQYSVRGGNYDENLIYVNDIEIYKPMFVKSGQQEGLSFVNSDLISNIQFAAGGFDVRYGDKMSSVLDIKYKRPTNFGGSMTASFLGGSAHLEGGLAGGRLTYIGGLRYKSNQYLLGSLQTKGDYKPNFFDFQTFVTYDVNSKFEISFLGNIARNSYIVVPKSRNTAFGTYQESLNFTVYYEGQEKDRFNTMLGAITLDYHPTNHLALKLTGSGFNTFEAITYDILGLYRIDLLDNTIGSETSGDSILNIGVGGNLMHARNYFDANIFSLTHKGSFQQNLGILDWGFTVQSEKFNNKIREWEMIDSAGYSLPYSDYDLSLYSSTVAENRLTTYRAAGYIHHVTSFSTRFSDVYLNSGIRITYLNSNRQWLFSPRIGLKIVPLWKKRIEFNVAIGWYNQPPFYKEMLDPDGTLHQKIRAQKSIHYVIGSAMDYTMWGRPFRFSTEIYYKKLDHLIPYHIEDVDIQYLPQYSAKGFAAGIEFKINGEFVKDAESWATLSFLKTMEDRYGDSYGAYPRATDQLVNFGMYFQDYFPNNPSYRVHLNIYYGSRLPYNAPGYQNPEEYYKLRSYKRIDIGLTKSVIIDKKGNRRIHADYIKDFGFTFEIFNLFGFNNQASYQWVRTVSNQEGLPNLFAVPNYLTGRLINLKAILKF
jgi:hypothetical protein